MRKSDRLLIYKGWFEPNHAKMPQLDTVTYLTQYTWTLIILFFLFSLLWNTVLPKLQQQLAIRTNLSSVPFKKETTKLEILKTLFQLK